MLFQSYLFHNPIRVDVSVSGGLVAGIFPSLPASPLRRYRGCCVGLVLVQALQQSPATLVVDVYVSGGWCFSKPTCLATQ